MSNHSASDQINFVTQWFRTWSDFQKEDFVLVLSQKLSSKCGGVNVTVNGMTNGNSNGYIKQSYDDPSRPPTLFACQIKLFKEWWDNWNEEDQEKLTSNVKENDGKFWGEVEAEINGTRKKGDEDFYAMLNSIELEQKQGNGSPGSEEVIKSVEVIDSDKITVRAKSPAVEANASKNGPTVTDINKDTEESSDSKSVDSVALGVTTIHISGDSNPTVGEGELDGTEDK